MIVALPGTIGAGLAPGMADLDAGHRAASLDRGGDPGQPGGLFVVPQAQARRRNPPFRRDGGGFDNEQAGPTAARLA